MQIHEIKVMVQCEFPPAGATLVGVLEEGFKIHKVKVISSAETFSCDVCGNDAEVISHWSMKSKKWYQFWVSERSRREYYFSSEHPCCKDAARKYAKPGDAWWKEATGVA